MDAHTTPLFKLLIAAVVFVISASSPRRNSEVGVGEWEVRSGLREPGAFGCFECFEWHLSHVGRSHLTSTPAYLAAQRQSFLILPRPHACETVSITPNRVISRCWEMTSRLCG
ncbi:hypothetical protein F5Y02DRAFT_379848 [Annulohypoxylon stygium]|nr:hypothetical protein F5Y02DRAFT_379848 [Annulohypoxylon stygium]